METPDDSTPTIEEMLADANQRLAACEEISQDQTLTEEQREAARLTILLTARIRRGEYLSELENEQFNRADDLIREEIVKRLIRNK